MNFCIWKQNIHSPGGLAVEGAPNVTVHRQSPLPVVVYLIIDLQKQTLQLSDSKFVTCFMTTEFPNICTDVVRVNDSSHEKDSF